MLCRHNMACRHSMLDSRAHVYYRHAIDSSIYDLKDFMTEMTKSEQRDKQKTLLSNCTKTANSYKCRISQDNNK